MLVLTRREKQSTIFALPSGDVIRVEVSKIKGDTVRIAIDAPKTVNIFRDDIKTRRDHSDGKTGDWLPEPEPLKPVDMDFDEAELEDTRELEKRQDQ